MAQIRKMLEHEAELVLRLWNENCLEAAGAALSDRDAANVLALLRQYASHKDVFCLVSEEQDGLVGFLTARAASHPLMQGLVGEIEELFVQPHHRRSGIGTELVNHAVSILRQQGASPLRVLACAESPTAREFWRSLGWEHDLDAYSLYDK